MRMLTQREALEISGAKTAILKLTVVEMDILVTYSTRFMGTGTYGGHRLNMIIYPNEIHDLNDRLLPYNVSDTIFHNGHKIVPVEIEGGHIYKIFFDEG